MLSGLWLTGRNFVDLLSKLGPNVAKGGLPKGKIRSNLLTAFIWPRVSLPYHKVPRLR